MALDVITSISLDMQNPYSTTDMVHVNQYDSGLRVKAVLLNAGQKWEVPSGAKAVVAFKKSDNIGGFYDATDDDLSVQAVSVDSNRSIIYISLDAQTTTTPTTANQYVVMQVVFYQNGKRLSTFAFYMDVRPSVVASKDITSSWVFHILAEEIASTLTVATTPDAMREWLETNIHPYQGYPIDDTLTVPGAASDAAATGKMVTVSDQNPNTVANKVWVKKTPYEVQVPTMDDYTKLVDSISNDGYRNYFADPKATYLKNGATESFDINYDIFKSMTISPNAFEYEEPGIIVKKDGTSGNKLYGCTIKYDEKLFGKQMCFSGYLTLGNQRVSMYCRFFDSNDAIIQTNTSHKTESGFASFTMTIPEGTGSIMVWFGSQATDRWTIENPALTNGAYPITGGSQYWDFITLNKTVKDWDNNLEAINQTVADTVEDIEVISQSIDDIDSEFNNVYKTGYRNYFADPKATYLKNGATESFNINYDIFKSMTISANTFEYEEPGIIVKKDGTSGNKAYGCAIKYDEKIFDRVLSFAGKLNLGNKNVTMYVRFLTSNGTTISTETNVVTNSGTNSFVVNIPENTDTIMAWFGSQATDRWTIENPVLTSGNKLVAGGSQYWDLTMQRSSYVSTFEDLKNAIQKRENDIYIINDIDVEENLVINFDTYIHGRNHILSCTNVTNDVIRISSSNVLIDDITINGSTNAHYLVYIYGTSKVTLTNCILHYCQDSVLRTGNTSVLIANQCDIGYSYGNDGVSPSGSSIAKMYNSKMHDCYDEGLSTHNSAYAELYNCEFYNNGYIVGSKDKGAPSSFGGCNLSGGKMGIVVGCYSHDNCTYGIGLVNFQEDLQDDIEKCSNNITENNGSHGIFCTYCKHLTLTNNTCINNNGDAIHFGLDETYTPTISGINSSGYVAGNILYKNMNDNIVVEQSASSDDLYIQT